MDFTLLERADADRAAGDENDVRRNKNTRKPAMNGQNNDDQMQTYLQEIRMK